MVAVDLERPASGTTDKPSLAAPNPGLGRCVERWAFESTKEWPDPPGSPWPIGRTALPAFRAPAVHVLMSDSAFSKSEMMIVAAARELAGQQVCFVGVGLPNIAVNLAKRTVTPDLELVYEAGVFGARPARLPLSIGDPTIVTGATSVVSMYELFSFYLQGGLIDVGFLGAAQIDRFGNINTTVIGDYDAPTTRLPGSGGACEIAINAREVFVIMRQSKRSFVEKIDFRTSAGNLGGAADSERIRREQGWLGRGPSVVVTDLGIWHFDDGGEMRLDSLHPGVTVDELRAATGWAPNLSPELGVSPLPTPEELRLIREELDSGGAYTR
jgi:glutaconate CoA-transferase, subunit B